MDITVKAVDPRTDDNVRRVVTEAFGGPVEYGLVADLRDDPDAWLAGLSLGAFVGDELVGHIMFTRAHIGTEPAALLAPLAVTPAWQCRGVGSALVRAGLEAAEREGFRVALVLGHPSYYPRFGFKPAIPVGILPPYEVDPAEAWMLALIGRPGEPPGAAVVTVADAFRDPAMWRE